MTTERDIYNQIAFARDEGMVRAGEKVCLVGAFAKPGVFVHENVICCGFAFFGGTYPRS